MLLSLYYLHIILSLKVNEKELRLLQKSLTSKMNMDGMLQETGIFQYITSSEILILDNFLMVQPKLQLNIILLMLYHVKHTENTTIEQW